MSKWFWMAARTLLLLRRRRPLRCLSEMARVAPSHHNFIQVLFGPLILRERRLH